MFLILGIVTILPLVLCSISLLAGLPQNIMVWPNIVQLLADPESTIQMRIALLMNLLLISAAFTALISNVIYLYNSSESIRILKIKNEMILNGYNGIMNNMKETSALRHEWKNERLSLYMMYQQNKLEEIGRYLEKQNEQMKEITAVFFTPNFVINIILQTISQKAAQEGIEFRTNIQVPEKLAIEDSDLVSLLMNMLDNAIEACCRKKKREPEQELFIDLSIRCKGEFLAICCRNSYDAKELKKDENNHIVTAKKDKMLHGYGLRQMRAIVEKYQSILDISYENQIFTVQTALKLTEKVRQEEEQHNVQAGDL